MRRDTCGGCGSSDLEVFLDLGKTPLADRFPASADEPEPTFPLEVAVCTKCWLVQLLEVVDDAVLFGDDYGFRSSASPSLVAYMASYAAWLKARFAEQVRQGVVEIACNDGELLQHFPGVPAMGIDPAAGAVADATARGLNVMQAPFSLELASQLRGDLIRLPGLIIANNVAAHVADPHDFWAGIADLLAPDGVAVVEVQYLPDLLLGNAFDNVYHEHRFFYSATALGNLLAQHGLIIRATAHTPQQGGSIRVVLGHASIAGDWTYTDLAEQQCGLTRMATYRSFQGRVDHVRARLLDLLGAERQAGRRLAGYGATAKSTTLLHFCGIGPDLLEYVEDTTPAKIGRVTPGMHIPIVAPGEREPPDVFLLLAWNYLPAVLRRERAFLDGGGRFLVPIPVPMLL